MNIINEAAMAIMISLAAEYSTDNKVSINKDELWCLANNIYFEARAESYAGKQAVANVTQNRLDSKDHPDSYCGVVKEGPHRESWVQYMNGSSIESNANAWRDSVHIALDTMSDRLYDNTAGATYYYNHNLVYPHWAKVFEITEIIGNHTFMKGDH